MTVEELQKLLENSDPKEPVEFEFVDSETEKTQFFLECKGAYSTAGGRMTVLWFVRKD